MKDNETNSWIPIDDYKCQFKESFQPNHDTNNIFDTKTTETKKWSIQINYSNL